MTQSAAVPSMNHSLMKAFRGEQSKCSQRKSKMQTKCITHLSAHGSRNAIAMRSLKSSSNADKKSWAGKTEGASPKKQLILFLLASFFFSK